MENSLAVMIEQLDANNTITTAHSYQCFSKSWDDIIILLLFVVRFQRFSESDT
jgi:hypothetical protein